MAFLLLVVAMKYKTLEQNKKIKVKNIKIKNKNKQIVNKNKYIKEMKVEIYGPYKQIDEKDLKINQVG